LSKSLEPVTIVYHEELMSLQFNAHTRKKTQKKRRTILEQSTIDFLQGPMPCHKEETTAKKAE
jgi:hypothetical protein